MGHEPAFRDELLEGGRHRAARHGQIDGERPARRQLGARRQPSRLDGLTERVLQRGAPALAPVELEEQIEPV